MWASAGPGPSSSSPKQCKSDGHVKAWVYNSVSARSPLMKSKGKNYRECSSIKSAGVNALTGSVPLKMDEALQRVSATIRNQTHVALLSATSLNH